MQRPMTTKSTFWVIAQGPLFSERVGMLRGPALEHGALRLCNPAASGRYRCTNVHQRPLAKHPYVLGRSFISLAVLALLLVVS